MLHQTVDRACASLALFIGIYTLLKYLSSSDPYKCNLLTEGQWLDPLKQWQPPGCMLHAYHGQDMKKCLQRPVNLIGDSTIRQIFWAMAEKLDTAETNRAMHMAAKHSDLTFDHEGVELRFFWDPYLNSTSLHRIIAPNDEVESKSAIVVVGGGLWHANKLSTESHSQFNLSMHEVVNLIGLRRSKTMGSAAIKTRWPLPHEEALVAVAPVRVPWYQSLSVEKAATLTESAVNPLNAHLKQLSVEEEAPVAWSFSLMTQEQPLAYQRDGLHVVNKIAGLQADILLNTKCNSILSNTRTYPMDKTCCSAYRQPNWIQRAILVSSACILPLVAVIAAKEPRRHTLLPSRKISRALATLALALCYCYFADRTQIFDKLQKHYSPFDFQRMCFATLAIGFLSIRRPAQSMKSQGYQTSTKTIDQPFLSRDQTDEWKGWMQFLILIYHYTGASRVLPIYKVIRVLVASYLFMTGFGHTAYFYRKADYSLQRCAGVMLRINLLSVLLPYIMHTDYLFYYFAPLTSFWYLIVFFTMKIGHSENHSTRFLLGKMLTSALIVTAVIRTPGVLECIFDLLRKGARIQWNVVEWRFRVHLDNYIIYIGMLSAIAFIKIAESSHSETEKPNFFQRYFDLFRFITVVTAIVALPAYFFAVASITEKPEYNSWVPYVSWIPILSFVVLRNSSRHFRNFHSSLFAWLGRHSLETFTLQFHIWLAADTKGILSLGFGRWQNFGPLSIIFFWVSWHVAAATNVITSWIVDPSTHRRDAEMEASGLDMGLPRTKSSVGLSPYRRFDKALTRSASGISRTLRENLAARLALIVACLWLLNTLY